MPTSEVQTKPIPRSLTSNAPGWLVLIAANTGGPQALAQMLPQFPSSFPGAVLVLQRMRPGFTRVLAQQLEPQCQLPLVEPVDGQALSSGRILMPPSGALVTVRNNGTAELPEYSLLIEDSYAPGDGEQSVVDRCMTSAASVFGLQTVGILLTGLGNDGREGLRSISEAGGITMAQDEASSVVHDLPGSAISAGAVQHVVPIWSIADRVLQLMGGTPNAAAA